MSQFVDFTVEQVVAGAALRDPDVAASYVSDEQIREEHFAADAHRSLWRFVLHYLEHGRGPLTATALSATLDSHPDLIVGQIERDAVLAAAAAATSTPDSADGTNAEHARRLRDIAERRRVEHLLHQAHHTLQRLDVPPDEVGGGLAAALTDGQLDADPRVSDEMRNGITIADEIERSIADWESDEALPYTPTGLASLDRIIGGLSPGRLATVAARPAMGKSVLGLMFSRQFASLPDSPGHVLHWSIEMSPRELAERYVASSGITTLGALTKQDRRGWQNIDWTAVLELPNREAARRLRVLGRTPGLTVDEIVRFARRYHHTTAPVGLVVVDYVGLLEPTDPRHDERATLSAVTRRLKLLAGELDVPVVAISQLSRKVDERMSKRPIMSDLRGSGTLEQDSDQIIFVYRPSAYDENDRPGEADLIVAKNRGGRTGDALVLFQGEHVRFAAKPTSASPPSGAAYYESVPLPGGAA